MDKYKVGDKVTIRFHANQSYDKSLKRCMGKIANITECIDENFYYIDIGGKNWEWHSGDWFDKVNNKWEAICI